MVQERIPGATCEQNASRIAGPPAASARSPADLPLYHDGSFVCITWGASVTLRHVLDKPLEVGLDVGDRCGEASDYVPDRRRFFHLLRFLRSLG